MRRSDFTPYLVSWLVSKAKSLNLSEEECQILRAMADTDSYTEVGRVVGTKSEQARNRTKSIVRKICNRIERLGAKEAKTYAPDRHKIEWQELDDRVRRTLQYLLPRPVYWEDLAFMGDRLLDKRLCGPDTYAKIKEQITLNCSREFHP